MAEHSLGDEVRVTGTWTNLAGTEIDAAVVLFQVKDPGRNITSYTYGVDAEVVKSDTGVYYVDVDGNKVGRWFVHFYSTGSGKASEESNFDIVKSEFE